MQELLDLFTKGYTTSLDWFAQIPSIYLYLLLMLYMALEGVTVVLPREVFLIIYGLLVVSGKLNILLTLFFSALGTTLGATTLYLLALRYEHFIEQKILGRFFTEQEVKRAEEIFRKKGIIAVFLAQLIPGIRTLVSIPAGTFNINIVKFMTLTFAGAFLWDLIWLSSIKIAGGNIERVKTLMHIYSQFVSAAIVIAVLFLVIMWIIKRYKTK